MTPLLIVGYIVFALTAWLAAGAFDRPCPLRPGVRLIAALCWPLLVVAIVCAAVIQAAVRCVDRD